MPSDVAELVRAGYAGVRFAPTYEEVTARRKRRPVPLVSALAVVLVALGVGAVVQSGTAGAPQWLATFPADCDRAWTDLARNNPTLTPQHQEIAPPADHVFAFNDDQVGLRLYVFDPVLFACSRSMTGVVSGEILGSSRNNVSFLPDRGEETLNYLAAVGVRPEFIIGRVPSATTGVVAATATQGRHITATIADGFFAAWAPTGGLQDAFVIADRTQGGNLMGYPTALTGATPNVDSAFMSACRSQVHDRLAKAPEAGDFDGLSMRTATRDGDWALVVFASPRVMTVCELTDAGVVQAGATVFTAPADLASFAPLSGMLSLASTNDAGRAGPDRNWAVVGVPTGTQRGEFVLADGRTIEGRVDSGIMIGFWTGVLTGVPTMRAYTVDRVYEKTVDKPVTTRPR